MWSRDEYVKMCFQWSGFQKIIVYVLSFINYIFFPLVYMVYIKPSSLKSIG